MTEKVGFVGLGTMGQPMAGRIMGAGFPLTVWNKTAGKTADLADKGRQGRRFAERSGSSIGYHCFHDLRRSCTGGDHLRRFRNRGRHQIGVRLHRYVDSRSRELHARCKGRRGEGRQDASSARVRIDGPRFCRDTRPSWPLETRRHLIAVRRSSEPWDRRSSMWVRATRPVISSSFST